MERNFSDMPIDISLFLAKLRPTSPKPLEPARLEVISIESDRDEEKAAISYKADPRVYDSGKMFTVVYRRNQKDPDCIENQIVDCKDDKEYAILEALDEILPSICCFYDTVTRITIETVEGKLTAAASEGLDEVIPYLPIPPHLSHILTVPITELEKIRGVDMDVDRVKWRGQTYAFKKTGESLEGTLQELTILDKLSKAPSIIALEAIVVNRDCTVRGFLTPFVPTGNLESVFRLARETQRLAADADADADATAINWPLKLSWARQICRAVVELHAISAYNGDLKPQNVLIDSTGEAILIDFLPMGISDEFAAPEVLAKCHDHEIAFESVLTAPADIYSLGLVLWAVAEEKYRGLRPPVWRDGETPIWYIDIVQKCLDLDPEARPSAVEVVSLLERGGHVAAI